METYEQVLKTVVDTLNINYLPTVVGPSPINEPMAQGKVLWFILSALRGPDSDVYPILETNKVLLYKESIKEATTELIRAKIGMSIRNIAGCMVSYTDNPEKLAVRKKLDQRPGHFTHHAKMAFQVLGMSWDEVNPPIPRPLTEKEWLSQVDI